MTVETYWGRAHRGRVWHLLAEHYYVFCNDTELEVVEYLDNLPPRGGRVCPRCVEAVAGIQRNVQSAIAQESFVTGEPAAPNEYTTEAGANP